MLKLPVNILLTTSLAVILTACGSSKTQSTLRTQSSPTTYTGQNPFAGEFREATFNKKASQAQVVNKSKAVYQAKQHKPRPRKVVYSQRRARPTGFSRAVSNAALNRLKSRVRYDGSYVKIPYPWGDVPANMGVCTDVVIRSYRQLGIDLQQLVHEDMRRDFYDYPNLKKWKLTRPDPNIDHRRVYNLQAFFARKGAELPITRNPRDYKPGDLVTWMVGPNFPHIGIVVDKPSRADPNRLMIVHNIAKGPQMEDILFRFPITGHYRFTPAHVNRTATRLFPHAVRARMRTQNDDTLLVDAANRLAGIRVKSVTNQAVAPNYVKRSQPRHQQLARNIEVDLLNAAKDLNILR